MKASFNIYRRFGVALTLLVIFCGFATASPSPTPKETPVEAESSGDNDFDITVLPAGEPVKGIKIPYYGADGTTLQMTMAAEEAKRINDAQIEMKNLAIEAESDDGRKFYVEFPASIFNIETRMLTGDQGVVIKREDFEISGKAAEFDVRSRFGKVIGNVKMTIFNTEEYE
ncbi:MAG: hypothetical protein Fur0032_09740 [Terrimicrobiaceae bacterium]